MKWVLNIAYVMLLAVLSPVIAWRNLRHGRYRRGWKQKLFGLLPVTNVQKPVVWFHAVSVGEVLQLQKVVDQFRKRTNNRFQIVVTTSTDTGFDLATERFGDCIVSWFPLDFSWAVDAAIFRIRPEMVVLVELELWPNFLRACRNKNVRTALINARMSDRSFRGYARFRALLKPTFAGFSLVAAQSDEYAERLRLLGAVPNSVRVTGSIKFDGVQTDRNNDATRSLRRLFCIDDSDLVFIAGSTQSPEEKMALDAWRELATDHPQLRLILVPRHCERFDEVATMVESTQCPLHRRSRLLAGTRLQRDAVILLDTIGELGACWGLADIAFVGGSFGSRGGQNMLEPAAYGAAVMFGPNTWNFSDIVTQLLNGDAAVRLNSPADLLPQVRMLIAEADRRHMLGDSARRLVLRQQGALEQTIDLLEATVCDESVPHSKNAAA